VIGIVTNCSYPLSSIFTLRQFVFLAFFVLTAAIFLLYPVLVRHNRLGLVSLSLIAVGGIINIAERIITGCIRDYFSFFGLFNFNVADLVMDIGIVLTFYIIWKKK